ncbi:MAG TPA: hypothetical protein VJT10_11660 [Steroidobacteraceae bacterium]|nr:hypothetical protein [Steroidobacteraceae bacterium]
MKPSACDLPPGALLRRYQDSGAYADCYTVEVPRRVSHAEYVEAFYTTFVFKAERVLLSWLVSKPSTDMQAARLARGEVDSFAAWTVEARAAEQLVMADYVGRTKSWLMIAPSGDAATRLYFGSAVVPVRDESGQPRMGRSYSVLLGFHKLYSRVLLQAAAAKITTASA